MKSLVLAEKPSVGRELSRILGCRPQGRTYMEGDRFVVTWALGHLVTLADPDEYDARYKTWRMEDLPMMPEQMRLKVIRQSSHQFRAVKDLMKRGDIAELIIATDAGREGELVARWIMKLAGWKKPFKRLWISSQTDAAIKEGFAKLKPGPSYDPLYQAARCRSEADWLIGLNVTRALTCKHDTQLTAGRVQTPTLAMIVAREQEIRDFIPQDYWTINADFGDYRGRWRDANGNARLFSKNRADEMIAKTQGHPGIIDDVQSKIKSEPPPLAYDLTELQRDANRLHGWPAKKTLQVLQGLYETHKVVTYPRTDSRYITSDMVPTLPARLQALSSTPLAPFARKLSQATLNPGSRFVNNARVSDHHAIIPTEQAPDYRKFTGDERMLYDLIARRFVTVLFPSCLSEQITLTTRVNGEAFVTRGKIVKDAGWRAVTAKIAGDDSPGKDELPEQTLKEQKKGDQKAVKGIKLDQAQTTPPPRYTEATLLTAMESPGKFIEDDELREAMKQAGLGTPATRAEIIEKLLGYGYMEREGSHLVPTSRGTQVVSLAPKVLSSPELTAQWELRLDKISRGQENPESFLTDIRRNTVELVQSVKADTSKFHEEAFKLPEESTEHRMSRKERAEQKYLIRKYSDQKEIKTNLGDLLKKALEEKK